MSKRKHYTQIQFGYYDGNIRTVRLMIGEWEDGSVTLEGDDLDMVTAAFFHLRGHQVHPGLKHYGLRKYKNGATTEITDDRMSRKKGSGDPLSYSLSINDARPGDLRLWVESTHTRMWLNFEMDKKAADEFGRRLSEAAEWDAVA